MNKKTWLITGISSGLGKALAQVVVEQGDFVIGTCRQETEQAKFNQKNKGKAKAFLLDLTDPFQIESVVEEVHRNYGRIDVLVNNAGFGLAGAVEETSIEETRHLFEANFFGTLKLTQQVLPLMRNQRKGHVIQISSHGGVKAFAGFGIYNASKFALEGFSEALALEVGALGIKVTLVEPGPFRTAFAGGSLASASKVIADYAETAGAFREKLKNVHGKQEGDPEKAAKAIFQLAYQDNPPLRLPLGKTALASISSKIESVKKDLEDNRKVAEEAVYTWP